MPRLTVSEVRVLFEGERVSSEIQRMVKQAHDDGDGGPGGLKAGRHYPRESDERQFEQVKRRIEAGDYGPSRGAA